MPSGDATFYEDKRDWSAYNERLVQRGELYLDLEWVGSWDDELAAMNGAKRGRPYRYPESMVEFLAAVRVVLRLPYRSMEGFLRGLSKVVEAVEAPDYTTLWWRMARMDLTWEVHEGDEPVVIAVDSSGLKVTNRGEWLREKWPGRRTRGWIKVHVAVDVQTREIVALEVTDERVGDTRMFPALVKGAEETLGEGRVARVLADAAYDSRANFQLLRERGIEAGIRIKRGASRKSQGSMARPLAVRELRRLGYEGWRERYGYGKRWSAEQVFSSVKRMMGEGVLARRKDLMMKEAAMKFMVYNALLGGPMQ